MKSSIRKKEKEASESVPTIKKNKDHMIFIRLPFAMSERFRYQSNRLSCSMNMLARMAIVRHLEELEAEERRIKA